MVMEGWLTNVTFFPFTSVFRSLHLCSCFSLLVIFIYFFISLVPSVSLYSCSSWSLSVLSVLVHFSSVFFCIICLWFSPSLWLLFFVLVSLGLYLLVGSTTYGEGKLKFPFAGGRSQVSMSSLCLCLFLGWPGSTRINPSDPWPDHLTGSMTRLGFKTMQLGVAFIWREKQGVPLISCLLFCFLINWDI
jgi:hypothetical protein